MKTTGYQRTRARVVRAGDVASYLSIEAPDEVLVEEAYDWARTLTDDECLKRYLVSIDVNMAFAAAANGTIVGLGVPVYVESPVFDPKVHGSWLVDFSHVETDERLPSPFTPKGNRSQGPAWHVTPTMACAVGLGHTVAPIEAHLRPESGRFLDGWYRLSTDPQFVDGVVRHSASPYSVVLPPGPGAASDRAA